MAVLCRGGSLWLSWRDASQETIMRGHLARLVAEGGGGAGKGGVRVEAWLLCGWCWKDTEVTPGTVAWLSMNDDLLGQGAFVFAEPQFAHL